MNLLSALLADITAPRLTLGTFGPLPILTLPLNIRLSQANTHWHIIGTSGSGKSFFLAQLFLSLLKHGSPVTLIDPHSDLAKLVLTHLVGQGRYKDKATYERIVYLDLPARERQERFVPFNPLKQDSPEHTIAANVKKAMHRAFPELSQGAAIFDTLLPRALRVLLANNLPITALEPFLWDEAFRSQLLARLTTQDAATITSYFAHVYADLRRSEQIASAGSVLTRAALLDEYALEKTHPVFYNLVEQWQGFTEYLQDLPPRHFVLKLRGHKVKIGKTQNLPLPWVDAKELLEVEQEYLRRYFRSKQEIAPVTAAVRPTEVPSREKEIKQSLAFYQPINRRERLR